MITACGITSSVSLPLQGKWSAKLLSQHDSELAITNTKQYRNVLSIRDRTVTIIYFLAGPFIFGQSDLFFK